MSRLLTFLFLFVFSFCLSQSERKMARDGNKYYSDSLFLDSELKYRKALAKNKSFDEVKFNLSDALFKQDRFDESISLLNDVISNTNDSLLKSQAYYNLGNNFLKKEQLSEAIDSYKSCLKINPKDEEASYNLTKSMSLLNNNNENNEKGDDQNKDDKENKSSGETDGEDEENKNNNDNKDQSNENNSQSSNNQNNSDEKSQQQDQSDLPKKEGELSKDEIKRILEALDKEEKKVQEKIKKLNLSKKKNNIEKDW